MTKTQKIWLKEKRLGILEKFQSCNFVLSKIQKGGYKSANVSETSTSQDGRTITTQKWSDIQSF